MKETHTEIKRSPEEDTLDKVSTEGVALQALLVLFISLEENVFFT